ncbi:unnamed protein product [Dovyalis caffra]|uniref:Uncharacterized protein n=1 Tax=Dovyalis caffra TaxID=77055 RepID=A0AAV1QZ66_9ROSI|nr:unnamed protein product [Dovyalis caffra]
MAFMHKEWKAGFHVPELEVAAKRLFFTKVQRKIVPRETKREEAYVCWRFHSSKSVDVPGLFGSIRHSSWQEEDELFHLQEPFHHPG